MKIFIIQNSVLNNTFWYVFFYKEEFYSENSANIYIYIYNIVITVVLQMGHVFILFIFNNNLDIDFHNYLAVIALYRSHCTRYIKN